MKISSVNALLTTWLCLVSLSNGSRRSTSTTPYVDYRNLVEVVASLSNRLDLLSARVSRLLPPNPPPSSPPRRHQFSGASDQGQPLLTTEGVYRPDSWFRKRTQEGNSARLDDVISSPAYRLASTSVLRRRKNTSLIDQFRHQHDYNLCRRVCLACRRLLSRRWSALCLNTCEDLGLAFQACIIAYITFDGVSLN